MRGPTCDLWDRPEELPRWFAEEHRRLEVDEILSVEPPAGGLGSSGFRWSDLVEGGGFALDRPGRLRRRHTLPDMVGPGMGVLAIGLNPSPTASETGIGFARPGNRFWPAALASGLVEVDRDPSHALDVNGVGFTDIAKRTTRRASELTAAELTAGLARLERLTRWLRPRVCVMIGLMGWRTTADRCAVAGWQDLTLGDRPLYLMPSTSGLNANSSLSELTEHLRVVARAR